MPQVVPPPAKPIESDVELFAKAYFNIHLTSDELKIIEAVANNKQHILPRKRSEWGNARRVVRAYLVEGLKPGGRVRLPQHPLPPRDTLKDKKFKHLTQEGKVLKMIQRPEGAYNFELSRIALKYTSVISELRKEGHHIIADRQYLKNGRASNTYKYRIGGQ